MACCVYTKHFNAAECHQIWNPPPFLLSSVEMSDFVRTSNSPDSASLVLLLWLSSYEISVPNICCVYAWSHKEEGKSIDYSWRCVRTQRTFYICLISYTFILHFDPCASNLLLTASKLVEWSWVIALIPGYFLIMNNFSEAVQRMNWSTISS